MMQFEHEASKIIEKKYCQDTYEFFCYKWDLKDAEQEELVAAVETDKEPDTANHFLWCLGELPRERMLRLVEVVRVHGRTHLLKDTLYEVGDKLTKEERWRLITTIIDRDGRQFYNFFHSHRQKLFTPEEWAYAAERKDQMEINRD